MTGTDPAAEWRRLAGEGPEARAVGEELLRRWSEPHRSHHTLAHLRDTLRAADLLLVSDGGADADADAVRYAVWFHDAVYEGRPGEDEEQSALLAERMLGRMGVAPTLIGEVARLVRLTTDHHAEAGDHEGAVLCDADLSVLGSEPEGYLTYAAAVREEYRHVPDHLFRVGRIRVLKSLLDAPRLFRTEPGRRWWEARARANVSAEVERLRQASDEG